MTLIRPSRPPDLAAVTAIYAQQVLHGTGTFETEPPTLAEMTARREDVLAKQLPFLVAEEAGSIIGFAYCNWFKARPAYRYSAEDSIYLSPEAQRRGIGRALLSELAARAEAAAAVEYFRTGNFQPRKIAIGGDFQRVHTVSAIDHSNGCRTGRDIYHIIAEAT